DLFLDGACDVGKDRAVTRGELEADAGVAGRDLHVEPAPPTPDLRAVDRVARLCDERVERRRRNRDAAARRLGHDVAHPAPTAASRVSSRKLVEYRPLRNASLARIS